MEKKDISNALNSFLCTNIKFEKLSKKDLETLYNIFNDPKKVLELLHNTLGTEQFATLLVDYSKELAIKKAIETRPLRSFFKNMLGL